MKKQGKRLPVYIIDARSHAHPHIILTTSEWLCSTAQKAFGYPVWESPRPDYFPGTVSAMMYEYPSPVYHACCKALEDAAREKRGCN